MHIRWMIACDMREVLTIERDCFTDPWSESDFVNCLRQRNVIGMVAEHEERVVGYMLYELNKDNLHLLNLAVHPGMRRQIIGASMVQKLFSKLSRERRRRIVCEVRESNLQAQLFFKSLGFFCVELLREFYDKTDEPALRFQYDLCPPVRQLVANRVSEVSR
jgi:[ribosomal protein S18]-alanine N-acetyltransferase